MATRVIVNRDEIGVHMGPGEKYPVTGKVLKGYEFIIIEQKNGFGRLKSKTGWIELKFCKTV